MSVDGPRAGTGARIVVVEDHPDAAESLVLLLELLGHDVRVFGEGLSALNAVHADPPDLMVVDIGLPDINGYEVARRVRRDPALRDAILVALTGHAQDEDKEEATAAGFDHHLVKPVEPRALEALVTRLTNGRNAASSALR
jgi:two-component system CheB/CheR fusion protein